ncbi:LysR substrate-binding domain-containing protein [Sulfitobacter sp. PS-8MA]|uniref:LysR substrate-binding domain-containing protein n=1 Tax=Sulfitobacter sp. PS-8MA TaxID=3237707 RepID=UPI0034C5FBDD
MAESDGFSFLSDKLLDQLGARYDLREVPVREPLPTYTLAIMTRRQTAVTPAAETLIRQLKARAQKPPV